MPILEAAAANVESTLAFMLSSKIVEIVGDLRGSQGSDPRDSTLFLCIGILFLSAAPVFLSAPSPPTAGRKTGMLASAARVGRDMLSLASEVLLLAFSRLVMQQVRLSKFVVDPVTAVQAAVFQYAQRIAEILFVGIVLACSLTTFLPTIEKQRGGIVQRVQTGPLLGKQLNSVVLNIQRTFADTVASIIPDVQTRRMVVLLGLCMLPSIASVVSGSSSISMQQIEAFFLLQQRTGKSRDWHPYARLLLKICVTGLSMAWINTALGFIMPSLDPSSQADALDVWISLVSTLCLAILMQSLHPMFPGLNVFQGYIEWSIASNALGYFTNGPRASRRLGSQQVLVCAGLGFYCIDALQRDVQRTENSRSSSTAPRLSYTLHTLQSVTVIIFTNSLVAYAMELVSPAALAGKGKTAAAVGSSLGTVVVGLVVAKTVMQVVGAYTSKHH